MQSFFPGDHGARAIPVPIPNTEVKTRRGDGTASLGGGRVARCQDFFRPHRFAGAVFCALTPGRALRASWRRSFRTPFPQIISNNSDNFSVNDNSFHNLGLPASRNHPIGCIHFGFAWRQLGQLLTTLSRSVAQTGPHLETILMGHETVGLDLRGVGE